MNRFFGFVGKESLHIIRDLRTMMILFGIPVVQILLFGYVLTNEIKDADIAILDHSRDVVTSEITAKLLSSGYFRLAADISSTDEVEPLLRSGRVRQVIIFEPMFAARMVREGSAAVQIVADGSDANAANMVVSYATAVIGDYVAGMQEMRPGVAPVRAETRMLFNEELKSAFTFVPGTMALILMILSAMMTSVSIAREKEKGTMEVLLVSPLRPVQIVLGKVLPYVVLAFLNAVIIIVLGVLVFDMPVMGSTALLMGVTLLYISLSLSMGIMISTMARTQQTAIFISMFMLLLPVMLLSGFIFPISSMPLILQWMSKLIPATYFIVIIQNLMLKGAGIGFVWVEMVVLAGMMLLFIVVSVLKFKPRLE